jgi:hypothetical protein
MDNDLVVKDQEGNPIKEESTGTEHSELVESNRGSSMRPGTLPFLIHYREELISSG